MLKNKGVSMITLVITIILIIILTAITFLGMDDATGSAGYAKFASEFGDYATNFNGAAVSNVRESLGLADKVANKAQIVYCAARKVDLKEFDKVLNGITVPGGYTSPRFQSDIRDATGAVYVLANETTPVYEIKNDVMQEYTDKKFYGDANGVETHWVTATSVVFTLPGYPRTVNGESRMYINAELYYVVDNAEMIQAADLIPLQPVKSREDESTGNQKTVDAADNVGNGGEEKKEDNVEIDGGTLADKVKIGDYVNYPVEYTNVEVEDEAGYKKTSIYTGWRVISKSGGTVKLVSAGIPLTFYAGTSSSNASLALSGDFLNTLFKENGMGYRETGFDKNKTLKEIFTNDFTKMSNGNPAVQALTRDDITSVVSTDKMAENDLFLLNEKGESPCYWLALKANDMSLWYVSLEGGLGVNMVINAKYGVRPVVTLKASVCVNEAKYSNGSKDSPWEIMIP